MTYQVIVCARCRHYIDWTKKRNVGGDPVHMCTATYVDRIGGELIKEEGFCRTRRADPLLCGPAGDWFEEKPA